MKSKVILLLCCALLIGAGVLNSQNADLSRIQSLRAELEQSRALLQNVESQEQNTSLALNRLQDHIRTQQNLLNALEDRQKKLLGMIGESDHQDTLLRAQIQSQRQAMLKRIVLIYRQGLDPSVVADQASGRGYLRAWVELKRLLNADLAQIRNYGQLIQKRKDAEQRAKLSLNDLSLQREEYASLQNQLRSQYSLQDQQFAMIRKSKDSLSLSILNRIQEERRLTDLVGRLDQNREKQGVAPLVSRMLQGRKCSPVQGRMTSSYGKVRDQKLETETFNTGIEIAASAGSPVVAARDGRVVSIKQQAGWGNTVILSHDGGYFSVYAHLAEINVQMGQEVGGCEQIASVAQDLHPHLSFHLYQNKQHIDPSSWVQGVK